MELEDLLAPVAGEFDLDEALESWRWLVAERVRPLAVTAFGDLFLTRDDGAVLFLDTISGTLSRVAESVADLEEKVLDEENRDEWFMPGFVDALRNAGHYLSQGECYSARHSIIGGGEWSVENFQPIHWRIHFAAAGQLIERLKDLPPGTKITSISYPKL